MPSTVVRFRCTSPEAASENQRLVDDVFRELEAIGASGCSDACFRLDAPPVVRGAQVVGGHGMFEAG